MKDLLDTSVWVRAALQGHTLPPEVRELVADPRRTLGLSAISLWEVAEKYQKGKLPLPMDLHAWFERALPPQIRVLPLNAPIIVESTSLPDFPVNDPADELIVATARLYCLNLWTSDTKLRGYRHAAIRYFTPQVEETGSPPGATPKSDR